MSKKSVGPVVKIQGFDANGNVVWEATDTRVQFYRAAPLLHEAIKEVADMLATHPEAKEGNAKVHYCLCKLKQALAEAAPKRT